MGEVKVAEIKLAAFIVQHNIPFKVMDHLTPLLTNIFPDSKIAKELTMKRTKTRNNITNVIGDSRKSDLTEILRRSRFSVLVDESTDISVTKTACIVVRYFDQEINKIVSALWEYI